MNVDGKNGASTMVDGAMADDDNKTATQNTDLFSGSSMLDNKSNNTKDRTINKRRDTSRFG